MLNAKIIQCCITNTFVNVLCSHIESKNSIYKLNCMIGNNKCIFSFHSWLFFERIFLKKRKIESKYLISILKNKLVNVTYLIIFNPISR